MFFHVILTTECNSQCRYCFGEALDDMDDDFSHIEVDYSIPTDMSYDVSLLDKLCQRDTNSIMTFYGGEPLMRIGKIRHVMDNVRAKAFMVQTNGLLLDCLEREYVNSFHTILVSIDGEEALTDFYRGNGTFRRLVSNLKLIRRNGFRGELIARMTVMEQTDIYEQVRWLLGNDEFPFTSVHWQLNAGFWKKDFPRRDFRHWSTENYDPGITRLVEFWVDTMEKRGVVLHLYPFLGITESLLSDEEKSLLRCGAGWINYAIQTDGHIIPCPAMWGMKDYYLGHINDADPLKLKKIYIEKPCTQCNEFNLCGGRCLYAVIAKRWTPEAYARVCGTVHNLIRSISAEMPRIKRLLDNGRVKPMDFDYMKYNGCEIIP